MKDFIKNTFQQFGYHEIGRLDDFIVMKMNEFEDYWVIAEGLDAFKRQSEIHDSLASGLLKDYPKFEKNTSMLLLVKNKVVYEDNMNVEKDPFMFKKYVLNYSDEALVEMGELINQHEGIRNAVMQEDVFKRLAEGNKNGGAALLYGLMHKLPFIPVEANPVRETEVPMFFTDSQFRTWMDMFSNMSDTAEDISQFVDSLLNEDGNEKA